MSRAVCTLCLVPRYLCACVRTYVCVHLHVPIQGVQCFNRGSLAPFLLSCELMSVTAMKTIAGSLAKPWPFLSISRPVPRRNERPEAASGCRRHLPF